MLGVWDYTVILTYISFASAGIGIFCAISMRLPWAIFFPGMFRIVRHV